MEKESKVIVITPIKNEAWVLDLFLETCSVFADAIILADQESNDESIDIANKFDKVIVVNNNSSSYDEALRQKLLIDKARDIFPNYKRILIALDADEIIAYNGLDLHLWDELRTYSYGTMLYFEKPDLLPGLQRCVRWRDNYFYLGFVDNGDIHLGELIHSKRLPYSNDYAKVQVDSIKVLHLAHARTEAQLSKLRYYSVIENLKLTKPLYLRRLAYSPRSIDSVFAVNSKIELIEDSWMADRGYSNNLHKAVEVISQYTWHDVFVLECFLRYGTKRFYLDNIWDYNWEDALELCSTEIVSLKSLRIKRPPLLFKVYGSVIDIMYKTYLRIRNAC